MLNLIETVQYYEDLRRLAKIKGTNNLEIVAITKRINNYTQNNKINHRLLEDLQGYGESLETNQELVICIKDLIYSVGDEDQTRIDIKIREGDCFKVVDFGHDTITITMFNGRVTIRMKKDTFRYYFAVINAKGKSIKDFFKSKIFTEMDNCEI